MKNNDRLADAYRILGLTRGATQRELKKAFHQKAMSYHPDLNPSPAAAEEFKIITNAYDLVKTHLKKHKKAAAPTPPPVPPRPEPKEIREEYVRVGEITARLSPQELMFRVANSQNPYVRMHAINAIAEIGGRDSAWCLIRSLQDPGVEVRRAAVAALGHMRAKIAVVPLIHLYRTSASDPETALSILDSLYLINSPMAAKFLAGVNASKGRAPGAHKPGAKTGDIA